MGGGCQFISAEKVTENRIQTVVSRKGKMGARGCDDL